ncbi:hypothetical protein J6590_002188 [Homalodisca vitripennis]|nr:hypothetical protein J6590_002188 [Homalodisca vitripennis]
MPPDRASIKTFPNCDLKEYFRTGNDGPFPVVIRVPRCPFIAAEPLPAIRRVPPPWPHFAFRAHRRNRLSPCTTCLAPLYLPNSKTSRSCLHTGTKDNSDESRVNFGPHKFTLADIEVTDQGCVWEGCFDFLIAVLWICPLLPYEYQTLAGRWLAFCYEPKFDEGSFLGRQFELYACFPIRSSTVIHRRSARISLGTININVKTAPCTTFDRKLCKTMSQSADDPERARHLLNRRKTNGPDKQIMDAISLATTVKWRASSFTDSRGCRLWLRNQGIVRWTREQLICCGIRLNLPSIRGAEMPGGPPYPSKYIIDIRNIGWDGVCPARDVGNGQRRYGPGQSMQGVRHHRYTIRRLYRVQRARNTGYTGHINWRLPAKLRADCPSHIDCANPAFRNRTETYKGKLYC